MAERAKFEKWLRDLDAKRESTPTHVFDRVKADYGTRLQGVLDKLKEHTGEMQEHADNLAEQLEKLETSEQDMIDRHVETELRAQVGELSESEWEGISKKTERALAKLKQDQELIATDLKRIREILGSVDGSASAVKKTPADVDELAFLKSVIGPTPARSSTPASAARPEPQAEAKPAVKPEPRMEPKAAAPTPEPAKPVKAKPESLVEKPAADPMINSKGNSEEPLAVHVTGSNPIVLRTSGVVEQPKTLKCAECGSMNYPSEWYCERCGAELANV